MAYILIELNKFFRKTKIETWHKIRVASALASELGVVASTARIAYKFLHCSHNISLHSSTLMPLISPKMMALFSWLCLLLCFLIPSPLNSLSSLPPAFPPPYPLCHPHERSALIQFNNSFSISNDTSLFSYWAHTLGVTNPWRTTSWDMSRDCCTWSGVTCDEITGHVISLDLKRSGLQGILHSNSSLFFLSHLKSLILSHNRFDDSTISSQFGRFASMIFLDLSYSRFTGQVPPELSHMSKLVTLDLSFNFELKLETSSMKRIVANLTSLRELFLMDVNMSLTSPNSLVNLSTSLRYLDLSYSALKGEFPKEIFHLPNLEGLGLDYNQNLSGSFPQYNWSSPLRNLNLSGTGFLIDLPYLTRSLKYLTVLSLRNCTFVGSYPTLLGNLTQITFLDLSFNNFVGKIPWSFLNLQQLFHLDLSGNNFIGQLPNICSNYSKKSFLCDSSNYELVGHVPLNLKSLYLFENELNGTIPSWLYSLPSLYHLDLSYNQLTGQIDEFRYNSLEYLDLSYNKLHGLIPASIFQQVNLSMLYLSSNSLIGVAKPAQYSKLNYLSYLDLSYNNLSLNGISFIIDNSPNLEALFLSSCNINEFPYPLKALEYVFALDLSCKQIEGSIPQWLWNMGKDSLYFLNISHNFLTHVDQLPWKSLETIDLRSNKLQGHLPPPPPSTIVFLISNNQLVGGISSSICNLNLIRILDLSYNNLSGNIPSCIGNLSDDLSILNLGMNLFSGTIPQTFKKGKSLKHLNLHGNQLEGTLPRFLLHCEMLEFLDVGNNKINGSFPQWLESLPELQVLILRSNIFSGPIGNPKVRFPFCKLRIIDLSNNEFTGPLPTKFFGNLVGMMDAHTDDLEYMEEFVGGYIPSLTTSYYQYSLVMTVKGFSVELMKIQTIFIAIDFSKNNFTGDIPKLIGRLNSLKGLNFSHNKLTGNIPPSLGNLSNLEWLDLSTNMLFGKIPWQLATNLMQLAFLNISWNKLEGPIPRGPQFNTFKDDSYCGNLGLCGFPLSKSCSEDAANGPSLSTSQPEGDDDEHMIGFFWKVVLLGYGSGLVIGISLGYILLTDKTVDWLVESIKETWCRMVKRSKKNALPNGGIRRRN